MAEEDKSVEERPVEKAELSSGVQLRSGHPVVLLVGGVPGDGTGSDGTDAPGEDPADASGGDDPSGEGSAEGGDGSAEAPSGAPSTPSGPATPAGGPAGPAVSQAGTGGADATGGEPDAPTNQGGATADGEATSDATAGDEPAKPPEDEATPSLMAAFDAAHFETDRALPLKEALPSFRAIAQLAVKEPHRAALVIGHTDSVGALAHNRGLSLERAQSVAAYLKNDTAAWMKFYKGTPGSKRWGAREDQHMLAALPWGGQPWYAGPIDGDPGGVTREAVRKLQQAKGLPVTGTLDDRFTLTSGDGKVKQAKTVKDDAKKGDAFLDLHFTKLPTDQRYSLEADLGKEGGPQQVFRDVPYADLAGLSAKAKPAPAGDGVAALAARIHDPPDAASKKGREATLWNVPPK